LPPTKYQQPNRGVKDIFIACVDGLTGFPAAIETVFPKNQIQLCIVHMFAENWDNLYPTISKSWLTHWQHVIPFFAFPMDIRKAIYTTNAIESMNMTLRKVLRNHRSFPSDDSALKVIFLVINNIAKKWTMPIKDWKAALNCFAIEFGDRFPL